MHREEAEQLTVGDMFGYLNDDELNPHDELLKDFKTLLQVHRDYINGLSNSEYREFKKRQRRRVEMAS